MKIILHTLICIMTINMANAQNVNIPDANFKAALVNNPSINTNGDAEIQVTEAAAYNGYMNVTFLGIADLTGLESFTALDSLACNSNPLTSLDVSFNTALVYLDCDASSLTSLDVSSNTALVYLNCGVNLLTSLDVSANTALISLNCGGNQLTILDVSSNTALTYLDCSYNSITSLDVSANTALTSLLCPENQITSLDVSSNTALTYLDCFFNSLTSLNVSNNTALTKIFCDQNQLTSLNVSASTTLTWLVCNLNSLTSLNVSANTALARLECGYNQLTSLNVQNGNNTNLTSFYANSNPNLTCIQVDNVAYSNANWSNGKDATASFSTNCGVTSSPEIYNIASVQIFPNPATNHLTIAIGSNNKKVEVTITDITGKIIYATTAIDTQNIEVNTKNIAAGVYLVKIQTADFIATKKLVVKN